MKKFLPQVSLSQREVPVHLDARILAYAQKGSLRKQRFRRHLIWWSSVAAIVCVSAAAGLCWQLEVKSSGEHSELLAMGDFSRLDQSSYNISFELALNSDLGAF